MFKKIVINIIVLILIAIGFHYIRIYSILDNAYQTSELFKTVSNITVKRDIYNDNGTLLEASLEYRIKDDNVLAILKDSNDKIVNLFKVDLSTYTLEKYAVDENNVPLKELEEEIANPQEYLDITLWNLLEGRSFKEFFIDSLFRLIRMDSDNYIIRIRTSNGEEMDAYISRNDFTLNKVINLNNDNSVAVYSYELGNVTDDMLDIHNL